MKTKKNTKHEAEGKKIKRRVKTLQSASKKIPGLYEITSSEWSGIVYVLSINKKCAKALFFGRNTKKESFRNDKYLPAYFERESGEEIYVDPRVLHIIDKQFLNESGDGWSENEDRKKEQQEILLNYVEEVLSNDKVYENLL